MVHNGIEYGDMQLICEIYHIMKALLGMTNDEISAVSFRLVFIFSARLHSEVIYVGRRLT